PLPSSVGSSGRAPACDRTAAARTARAHANRFLTFIGISSTRATVLPPARPMPMRAGVMRTRIPTWALPAVGLGVGGRVPSPQRAGRKTQARWNRAEDRHRAYSAPLGGLSLGVAQPFEGWAAATA